MDKQLDGKVGNYIHRHLSQLRVVSRLVEHELDTAKGDEIVLDRQLLESVLDTLDIFVEDLDGQSGRTASPRTAEAKPAVARLN